MSEVKKSVIEKFVTSVKDNKERLKNIGIGAVMVAIATAAMCSIEKMDPEEEKKFKENLIIPPLGELMPVESNTDEGADDPFETQNIT